MKIVLVGLLIVFTWGSNILKAQGIPQEGIITYRVDFFGKVNSVDTTYLEKKLVVYKKGSLLRIEQILPEGKEVLGISKEIEIRNQKGIYRMMQGSEGPLKELTGGMFENPVFSSYTDDKSHSEQYMKKSGLEYYMIDRVLSTTTFLGVPVEIVLLRTPIAGDTLRATLARGFNLIQGAPFTEYLKLPGTLLKFSTFDKATVSEMRYTAISIVSQKLPASLFNPYARKSQ